MKCPKKNVPFSFSLRRSWARQGVPPSSGPSGHLPPGEGFGPAGIDKLQLWLSALVSKAQYLVFQSVLLDKLELWLSALVSKAQYLVFQSVLLDKLELWLSALVSNTVTMMMSSRASLRVEGSTHRFDLKCSESA